MQVILLERIGRLGQMGDVVTVKDGFARNFLLPQGKALRATEANRKRFETRAGAARGARSRAEIGSAGRVAQRLHGKSFIVIRQAGDSGQLYGSVSTRDISTAVTEGGFSIERRQVMLDRPIKTLGLHDVRIGLHAEVEPHVTINVARSSDEAARQARGEDVTGKAMDRGRGRCRRRAGRRREIVRRWRGCRGACRRCRGDRGGRSAVAGVTHDSCTRESRGTLLTVGCFAAVRLVELTVQATGSPSLGGLRWSDVPPAPACSRPNRNDRISLPDRRQGLRPRLWRPERSAAPRNRFRLLANVFSPRCSQT